MSSKRVCRHCGCGDIDIDSARGDAVCTSCGAVLEENVIVTEVQFEENSHGVNSAIGQFVGADGKIKGRPVAGFNVGLGTESRENTLRKAKNKIIEVAQQLRLNQHCIDTAFNFFKMALSRRLTYGRLSSSVVASCLYITCRTEGTPHLLIDFSDVIQVDIFELGRTFSRLANSLCINLPLLDPCLYILRFAHKLQFGDKTQDVTTTALRLVQRMKRDWIHTGRRPSGLCGAALLISGRLHGFHRTVEDVVKVARVNKSTLKKRLVEFGETPSSNLTLDEFMSVDLEEEQDPPAFKVARRKDKERLQKVLDDSNVTYEFKLLQKQIENMLERKKIKIKNLKTTLCDEEALDISIFMDTDDPKSTSNFLLEETSEIIQEVVSESSTNQIELNPLSACGLGPILSSSTANSVPSHSEAETGTNVVDDGTLDLTDIDDREIESYIMSKREIARKTKLWMKLNEEFLREQKEKQERLEKEILEGKFQKKKKYAKRQRGNFQSNTAGEAIEKMLREKRISNKINYDVLKTLNDDGKQNNLEDTVDTEGGQGTKSDELPTKRDNKKRKLQEDGRNVTSGKKKVHPNKQSLDSSKTNVESADTDLDSSTTGNGSSSANDVANDTICDTIPIVDNDHLIKRICEPIVESGTLPNAGAGDTYTDDASGSGNKTVEDHNEDIEDDELEEDDSELSVAQLLSQHRGDGDYENYDEEDDYY